jgi:hypothetical protein
MLCTVPEHIIVTLKYTYASPVLLTSIYADSIPKGPAAAIERLDPPGLL